MCIRYTSWNEVLTEVAGIQQEKGMWYWQMEEKYCKIARHSSVGPPKVPILKHKGKVQTVDLCSDKTKV